jgi:hypothetical protein
VVFGLLLFGLLAVVSVCGGLYKRFPIDKIIADRHRERHARKQIEDYIPHLTEKEANILGYLLKYNQKMFTATTDGGYAVTLISRGIVVRAMRGGQQASAFDVPYGVTDYVWNVLVKNKDKIVYKPEMNGRTEVHPWRVPSGF